MAPPEAQRFARVLEALGFGTLWFPGLARGAFVRARLLLRATEKVTVATGIATIWDYPPRRAAAGFDMVERAVPGRFVLGVGVAHQENVERFHRGTWSDPVEMMRSYLAELDGSNPPVAPLRRMIAALGPKMTALAAASSAGAHLYIVTPQHSAMARQIMGPGPLLAPEQAVVVGDDPAQTMEIARRHVHGYSRLGNYVRNWRRAGFGDEDLAGGGSRRLVDALVARGNAEQVARRVREHLDAGADHVAVQLLPARAGQRLEVWESLAEALSLSQPKRHP